MTIFEMIMWIIKPSDRPQPHFYLTVKLDWLLGSGKVKWGFFSSSWKCRRRAWACRRRAGDHKDVSLIRQTHHNTPDTCLGNTPNTTLQLDLTQTTSRTKAEDKYKYISFPFSSIVELPPKISPTHSFSMALGCCARFSNFHMWKRYLWSNFFDHLLVDLLGHLVGHLFGIPANHLHVHCTCIWRADWQRPAPYVSICPAAPQCGNCSDYITRPVLRRQCSAQWESTTNHLIPHRDCATPRTHTSHPNYTTQPYHTTLCTHTLHPYPTQCHTFTKQPYNTT